MSGVDSFNTMNDLYHQSNLSNDQLIFWLGQKLHPEAPLYNVPYIFSFRQAINPECFEQAFQTLFNASDTLRTIIVEKDGIPQRATCLPSPNQLDYLDFTQAAQPDEELAVWLKSRTTQIFNLETRLFDTALIKLEAEKFVWYLNQHHLITDIISVGVLFETLSTLYSQALEADPLETMVLPNFDDYVAHENSYYQSSMFLQNQIYWQKKVAKPLDNVSFFGQSQPTKSTSVERISYDLGPARSEQLRQLAQQDPLYQKSQYAPLFNIFATVLATYLHRMSANFNLVLGTAWHNRLRPTFNEYLGLFVQTLPMHVGIGEDETFTSLQDKIASEAQAIRRHSPYLGPSLNTSFDVALNYQATTVPQFQGVPVQIDWLHTGHGHKNLLLHIQDFSNSDSFTLHFDLHCDIFSPEQREQVLSHYLQLLDAFIEKPEQSIHRADLLSAVEKQKLLVDLNQTDQPFDKQATMQSLFESQVARTPNNLALVMPGLDAAKPLQALTYAELNERANQLAHYLRQQGVGPESLVAICLEKSPEYVISILAVLKAGGAYIPLDPNYPPERLNFMLTDSQALILISKADLQPPYYQGKSVDIEADWDKIAAQSRQNPSRLASPRNLAYVIYTSGSTGLPKGVLIEQQGVCNMIEENISLLDVQSDSRCLHIVSFSFDAATLILFTPLCAGACAYLTTPEVPLFPTLKDYEISHAQVTPTLLSTLALEPLPALKLITVGGEPCPINVVKAWAAGRRFLNVYGPTEITFRATYAEYEPGEDFLPIGRPCMNKQVYILDRHKQLLPYGVSGELYVSGIGVARGYLNRPELTTEKFIPHPFSQDPSAALYKTGDLVRYLPDGKLEFLGRIDNQVKIRGYRIELSEIEVSLNRHPHLKNSLVLPVKNPTGPTYLVAYIIPSQTTVKVPTSQELRHFLKKNLPDYMIPATFIYLEVFPQTPNGKIDLKALPPPDINAADRQVAFEPPSEPIQEMLATIWQDALQIDRIGIYDNFFELGGHSIIASRIVNALHHDYDIKLSLRDIFEYPTIAELAVLIEAILLEA